MGNSVFSRRLAKRLRLKAHLAVIHIQRDELHSLDAVFQSDPGDDAARRGAAHAAKNEIAEAVNNQPLLVLLDPLQDVGMVTQHQVGAGIDGRTADSRLVAARQRRPFGAPVEGNHHIIGRRPGPAYVVPDVAGIAGSRAGAVAIRIELLRIGE